MELARKALELLIVAAMPMVEKNASSIARLMPARIDKQDLVDAGYLALVERAQTFDGSRGTTLAQYARLGVRGAMWELVRRRNWREMSHWGIQTHEAAETSAGGAAGTICAGSDSYKEGLAPISFMIDTRQAPDVLLEEARKKARSAEAVSCLDARERMVVERYYAGEELIAIGREIGLCKQTMTNIHRRALGKMQEYFRLRGIKAA